jgi:hypothetical protein
LAREVLAFDASDEEGMIGPSTKSVRDLASSAAMSGSMGSGHANLSRDTLPINREDSALRLNLYAGGSSLEFARERAARISDRQ